MVEKTLELCLHARDVNRMLIPMHNLPSSDHPENRGVMRVPVQDVRCSQGRVVDLSTRGMRLVVPIDEQPVEGQSQHYEIPSDFGTIRISGTVCWVRESVEGSRIAEVGIVFDPIAPQAHATRSSASRCPHVADWPRARFRAHSCRIEHENLYAALGVAPDASDDTIRRAYHKTIKRWDPQRRRGPQRPKPSRSAPPTAPTPSSATPSREPSTTGASRPDPQRRPEPMRSRTPRSRDRAGYVPVCTPCAAPAAHR
jgi:hypothetical protein